MRVFSYNILDGGEGRADPLAEVIEANNPDVVALVEADDPAVLDRIAGRLRMDVVHAAGNSKACALLSRWPIRDSINHAAVNPGISKSFLEATVIDPAGAAWPVAVVHLHAHAAEENERRRQAEIAIVLNALARHRDAKTPHVLCGDFNANSPVQDIDPARLKESSRDEWQKNGGKLPRRVIQSVLDAGYNDSLEIFDPAAAARLGSFSTQHPGQRVDYIFTHGVPRDRVAAAWIEQDRLAKYASDHFPVGAEIRLAPAPSV